MFKFGFPLAALLCVVFEVITYKRFFKNKKKAFRIAYITTAILIPLLMFLATWSYFLTLATSSMALMTWGIWLFFMNLFVKMACAAVVGVEKLFRGRSVYAMRIALVLSMAIAATMTYGAMIERNVLRVERIEITSDKIPQTFDGYSIAQFSDVHLGNLSLTDIVEDMVDEVNRQDVDLVVSSGDLVNIHYKELTPRFVGQLKGIKAKDGIVSVLGNHDLGFYIADTTIMSPKTTFDSIRIMQQEVLGWRLLENENFHLYKDGDSISISGVTYPKNLNHNNFNSEFGGSDLRKAMQGVSDSTFSVMISHTPALFDSIPAVAKPDLMLSGHVHAMQFKIGSWSPAKWLYHLYSGLYRNGNHQLYINDGLGYVMYPMRIGARPELTIITLRSSKTNPL